MPEAAIHEDCDLDPREGKIGALTREPWEGIVHPEAPPARMESLPQSKFGGSVPRALSAHPDADLRRGHRPVQGHTPIIAPTPPMAWLRLWARPAKLPPVNRQSAMSRLG
jgi:hypothetical protein